MVVPHDRRYWYAAIGVAVVIIVVSLYRLTDHDLSHAQTMLVHGAPFSQFVTVSGTVEASDEVDLGFAQSGRISRTYVKVGDKVKAGAVIAETENGDLYAALSQRKAALDTAKAQLASLKAGTRSEAVAVSEAQVQSDTVALAQAKAALMDAIQSAYTSTDDAVHNKVDQFVSNPHSYAPSLSFNTSNSGLTNSFITSRVASEGMLTAWQTSVAALTSSDDLSSAYGDAKRNVDSVSSFLSDANAVLNAAIYSTMVTKTQVDAYIAGVSSARASVNSASVALTAAMTAVKNTEALLEKDQKGLALQQAGATREDLDAQEARVDAAQADVESARAQLDKTRVVAPFAGTITRMDAKVGEVVSPTVSEISMISDGLYEIKTYIPEVQASGVLVGNMATATLDAYGPELEFVTKVVAIDPAETTVNGISTYKTTLQFSEGDPRIRSGMNASVIITTSSSQDALVVPLGAVFTKGGRKYVQVARGRDVEDIAVQVSSATLGNVEVFSGLSDGDEVILNPDTSR